MSLSPKGRAEGVTRIVGRRDIPCVSDNGRSTGVIPALMCVWRAIVMKTLKEKLHRGITVLAATGAYVPAVHCHNAQQPVSTSNEPTPHSASLDGGAVETAPASPAVEQENQPGAPPESEGQEAAEPVAEPAQPESAESAPPPTPQPADLPERPGAGSRAECRFLEQIAQAGLPRYSGSPRLEGVVNQTYARFSKALGRAYQGEMQSDVNIESLAPSLDFTVSYAPTSEPWSSRYDRIVVRYRFAPSGDTDSPARPRRAEVTALGHLRAEGTEIVQSSGMCRLSSGNENRPQNCAYPRWNPRGARYGLFDAITPEDEG